MIILGVVAGTGAVVEGLVLTGMVRRFALRHAVLDVPNERSLHCAPTPRAGGVSITIVVLSVLLWQGWHGDLPIRVVVGLVGASSLIAAVGWVDDIRSLPSGLRVLVQVGAAAWFLGWAGGPASLRVGEKMLALAGAGWVVALVAIVWSINLFNFMDGIDGIAGGQAVVAATAATVLLADVAPGLSVLSASIAGASLGFLIWNWSPARIFMGDVGSGFLGFLFAAMALLSEQSLGPPFVSWVLFGGVFVFDATVTLLRRMAHGEKWYAAHRSHAYQRAVLSGWSHARVTTGAMTLAGGLGLLGGLAAKQPAYVAPAIGVGLTLLSLCYLWIEKRRPMWRAGGGN